MSSEWNLLDLPADADARAIKRAYAQRLKAMRPDEDPAGFQRLHEAYREALRRCEQRMARQQRDAHEGDGHEEPGDGAHEDVAEGSQGHHRGDRHDGTIGAATPPPRVVEAVTAGDASREHIAPSATTEISGDSNAEANDHHAGHRSSPVPPPFPSPVPRPVPSPVPLPFAPAPAPAPALSDARALRALAAEAVAMAASTPPDVLTAWLQAEPLLWSLTDKSRTAEMVLDALHDTEQPLAPAQFDALAAFFGFFDPRGTSQDGYGGAFAGLDMQNLLALRDRLELAHALEGGALDGIAERMRQDGGSLAANRRQAQRMLEQLRRPFAWPQALLVALVPGLPTRLSRFTTTLRGMGDGDLPATLDARQAAFWERAADTTRVSWPRAAVLALRGLLYPLLPTALAWLLLREQAPAGAALQRYLALLSALGLGWGGVRLTLFFAQWQAVEDAPDVLLRRWLRGVAIPLLLLLGLVLHFTPGYEPLSWLLMPVMAVGTMARITSSNFSGPVLVLLMRQGWAWIVVPLVVALVGAFVGSSLIRGLVYVVLALSCLGLWYGARARD